MVPQGWTVSDAADVSGSLVVAQDDNTLTLRQPLGVEQTFPRTEVAAVNALGTSLMPENLDAALTPQQLADLIAYLTRG